MKEIVKGTLTGFLDINGVGISNGDKVVITKEDSSEFKGEIIFELGAFMVTTADDSVIFEHYEDSWNDECRALHEFAWNDGENFDSETNKLFNFRVLNPEYEF